MAHPNDGFPVPNPTQSYWQTSPSALADHQSSEQLPKSVDFVIVGSGITGASTAVKLLAQRPNASVVLLEARRAASGASGRNGGHCRASSYLRFARDRDALGDDEAMRVQRFEEDNVAGLAAYVVQHAIACDLRPVETFDVCFTENYLAKVESNRAALESSVGSSRPQWLTETTLTLGEDTVKTTGLPNALGAVGWSAYALHPYKLVTAMLQQALDLGMQLHTHTLVRRIERVKDGQQSAWDVHTERGMVRASNVVLATNAYTPALARQLEGCIIPTRGQVAAIHPTSDLAAPEAAQRTYGLFNTVSVDYCQTRAPGSEGAGDIIIGGGRLHAPGGEQPLTDDSTIHPAVSQYLTGSMGHYFKNDRNHQKEVLQEWTGIMGYTKDQKPYIGELPGHQGLWVCAGFNGHGMALTYRAADAVVALMLDQSSEWIPRSFLVDRIVAS